MSFFFTATLKNWKQESVRYRELSETFQRASQVRLTGFRTDIEFKTTGRTYLVGDGTYNMPDGEIYTSPVDDSLNGSIYFEFPGVYAGQRIPGISLEFAQGKLTSTHAEGNEELLNELVTMDEGASHVGEFGVGTNYGIDRFCYDILYDEKIGGTIHLALGRAYGECGGVNQSAMHWDLIKDLRREGAIYLDGKKVFVNGKFLI
jgi:aminopeptidase